MPLKMWLGILVVLTVTALVFAAEEKQHTFYVQLIRGTNDPKPPEPNAKLVGPKLSQLLVPVFRWKYYWEISRNEVKVKPPQMAKLPLKWRDIQIEVKGDTAEVRLMQSGKAARTLRQKMAGFGIQIMGGTTEADKAWFVVVRQDKPQ